MRTPRSAWRGGACTAGCNLCLAVIAPPAWTRFRTRRRPYALCCRLALRGARAAPPPLTVLANRPRAVPASPESRRHAACPQLAASASDRLFVRISAAAWRPRPRLCSSLKMLCATTFCRHGRPLNFPDEAPLKLESLRASTASARAHRAATVAAAANAASAALSPVRVQTPPASEADVHENGGARLASRRLLRRHCGLVPKCKCLLLFSPTLRYAADCSPRHHLRRSLRRRLGGCRDSHAARGRRRMRGCCLWR